MNDSDFTDAPDCYCRKDPHAPADARRKLFRLRLVSRMVLALAISAVASCAKPHTYAVRGNVVSAYANGEITVQHEEVPGLMPAMTMPFVVAADSATLAASLQPGDQVEFQLTITGNASYAHHFKRTAAAAQDPAPTREPATAARAPRLREGDPVPDFALTDQREQPVTATDLAGRFTLVSFIFTRCPVPEFCPRISRQFATLAAEQARPDLQFLLVSFDPEHDTPAVLRDYGAKFGAKHPQWRLATGTPDEVKRLLQRFAVHVEPQGATLDHTLATALIGPDRRVQRIWRGAQWTVADVLTALPPASASTPTPGK